MSTITAWPGQAETWLDERGKGAWIAAMVLGFIFVWPVGLAILAYMIWSKRMFSKSCAQRGHSFRGHHFGAHRGGAHHFRTSGNTAFDAYKADTLDRLEREQGEFESFLERLRASKDKAEFDQYLDDRAQRAREAGNDDGDEADDEVAVKDPKKGKY